MNLHSGTAKFHKQIADVLDFPDPVGGFQGMYLNRTDTEALIAAVANNTNGISDTLYNQDSNYRSVWNAFHDLTNAQAVVTLQWCLDLATDLIEIYANKRTIYSLWTFYWQGATYFQRLVVNIRALLSLDQVRPLITATQKRQLKAALSLVGNICWDNDFVPMDNWQSFTLGTANMPIQYGAARGQLAAVVKDNPQFVARFNTVLGSARGGLAAYVSDCGAPMDCPHYSGAEIVPTTDVLQQLQVAGYTDVFDTNSSYYARLTGLGESLMQVMTPPQSRFGGLRKMVCYGDGASEGHDFFLSMIMGFESHNETVQAHDRSMGRHAAADVVFLCFVGVEDPARLSGAASGFRRR
jgi:hypothetical protein